jgi:hypothetical protein
MKLRFPVLFILVVAALLFSNNSHAQKQFEGKVSFNVFDNGETHAMDYYIKGSKIRFDTNEKGEMGQIIMDPASKQFMVILPQQKMYMVMPIPESEMKSETQAEMNKDANFTKTGETKEILGYKVEKWLYKDGNDQGEAWMTKDIGSFKIFENPMQVQEEKPQWQKDLEEAGYFPLEVSENGKKVFEVTSIEKKSLDESMFEAPPGFQKMDMPNMHK